MQMSACTQTTVCLQMYTFKKKKTASTVRPGSVSVTESGFISQQKRSESSVSWGAFVLTSDREWKWWVWDNGSETALCRDTNPRDGIIIHTSAHHTVGKHECRTHCSLWQPGSLFLGGRDSSLLEMFSMFWWVNRKTAFKSQHWQPSHCLPLNLDMHEWEKG